jgi:uncharacterized protein YacL
VTALIFFIKALLIIVFVLSGYMFGQKFNEPVQGTGFGLFLGAAFALFESRLRRVAFGSVIGGLVGLGLGILISILMLYPLRYLIADESMVFAAFILSSVLGYSGLLIGMSRGRDMTVNAVMRLFKGQEPEEDLKILDTSVIIDGRIADVIEIGFLGGTFVIPQFILQELQYIADSPDPLRRTKGRRGLEILHRVQKLSNIKVRIVEEDFPKIKEVDAKLIALARFLNAKVVTNDFNMSKVAQLQGVSVLNINELANILKPVVLPGEPLNLFIAKEGKEHNQGVAYLDDGTMVVVEHARKLIGKSADLIVTSVLQTTAGRMIFAKIKEEE